MTGTRPMRRLALALLCGLASAPTWSENPLGFYVGAGVGQSDVALDQIPTGASNPTSFSEHATGWKALAGLRPVPWLGAEIEYVDLGHPSTSLCCAVTATNPVGVPAAAKANGPALFGLAYLPLALLDVYGKVGVSRVRTSVAETAGVIVGIDTCFFDPSAFGCQAFRYDRYTTGLAWGTGVQLKLSAIGLRAEYERFGSGSTRPSLASLAVVWSF
jgi:opacity protein-like surface antigen